MSTILRGSLAAFLQNETWDYDPSRGYIHRFDYKGASQYQVWLVQQSYVNAGVACRLTYHQGDTATLEVEDSSLATLIDVWELVGNEESRDIWSFPALSATLYGLALNAEKMIADARQQLEDNADPSVLFGVGGIFYTAPALFQEIYLLAVRGTTEYRHPQYVLRHKTNAPSRWTTNIADYGVDKIYTPTQLITEINNSALWAYPCPARLQYKISNIPAPTAQTNYLWGWLKSASTETTAANNRVDIETVYTLEQWSTALYSAY